jgi:hypothetical protein
MDMEILLSGREGTGGKTKKKLQVAHDLKRGDALGAVSSSVQSGGGLPSL